MKAQQGYSRLVSKFITTYEKLFEGYTPQEISPHETPAQFWSNLLSLNVNRSWLGHKIQMLSKDDMLGFHKPFIHTMFSVCLLHFRTAQYTDSRKTNAVESLAVIIRCCLEKNLAGWEVMELFAGGIAHSDAVFLELMCTVDDILTDQDAPVTMKHQVLQLTAIFACGISQLSPGAYLLRRDLFPAIVTIIKSPETQAFTFEAALLLSVLANFHKSDAAQLNPYLRSLKEINDRDMMKNLCWSANYAMDCVVKAYQDISDDSPPTFTASVGNFFASFRPDRALSSTPIDPPRELFKNQPIEASVILLPIYEFLHLNSFFPPILLEPLLVPRDHQPLNPTNSNLPPLPYTILTLSSYLLAHASSVSSPRAVAYARLCLNILLLFAENDIVMSVFLQPEKFPIRLCRQRLPLLPVTHASQPPICALLDCCVLWLRHNIQKRLEVHAYSTCISVLRRILGFLQKGRRRLDYHWQELWRALFALLDFLANKLHELYTTGGVEQLVQKTIVLVHFALCNAELILPSPQAVHQFVYEVVRASPALRKQKIVLQDLALPGAAGTALSARLSVQATDSLKESLEVATHYEAQVQASNAQSAAEALRVIAKDIETDGLCVSKNGAYDDLPGRSDDVVELGFVRYACMDGMALMPGPE